MRNSIIFAAKLSLSVGLLLLIGQKADLRRSFSLITVADVSFVVVALIMLLVQFVLAALRWRTIVTALSGKEYLTSRILAWCGISALFSQALPSTIGGDVIRIGATARDIGLGAAFRTVLIDRAVGLTILSLLACAGALVALTAGLRVDIVTLSFVVGAAGIVGAVALGACSRLPATGSRWRRSLTRLGVDFVGIAHGPRAVWIAAISFAIHGLSIGVLLVLAAALGVQANSIGSFCALVPGVLLVSAIPISIGGWGVREGAMIVAMDAIGVSHDAAFALSISFGLGMIAIGVLGGLLWLAIGRQRHGSGD